MLTAIISIIGTIAFTMAVYERGQRKGLEEAEKLYEPVIEKLFAMKDQRELLKDIRNLAVKAALKKPIPEDWRVTVAKIDVVLGTEYTDGEIK